MVENIPDRIIEELLHRLEVLENRVARVEITELRAEELADGLARLESKIERRGASYVAFTSALMDERAIQIARLEELAERIKGLEVTVFPNLRKDLRSVNRILGGDGVPAALNPLDIRKNR